MEFQENLNAKWRRELFRICVILALIGTIAEIVIYTYDSNHKILFLSQSVYRLRFIYIPSLLNLIVIVVTASFMKSKKCSNLMKNAWACILIYFLCANTQVIHYVYGPLLMLPVIAIFVTILFANKILTRCITIASIGSLLIAARQASNELRKDDPQLVSDVCLAALVMVVAYIAARLLTKYVAEQMQYILTSNERQKILIEECNMDALMGIGNRRALNQRLDELVHNNSDGVPFYLCIWDIDDFKKVNDTYGHLCGDEVLIQLADLLKENIKTERAEVYRYGGEEIVVLLNESEEEKAYHYYEEKRKKFSAMKFSFDYKCRITISGGLSAYYNGITSEKWIQQADAALYQAKSDGKNRIIIGK